jgi:hypothetical protein
VKKSGFVTLETVIFSWFTSRVSVKIGGGRPDNTETEQESFGLFRPLRPAGDVGQPEQRRRYKNQKATSGELVAHGSGGRSSNPMQEEKK